MLEAMGMEGPVFIEVTSDDKQKIKASDRGVDG